MKLLFPIFASLVLQYQVNTEFLVRKKCLNGFGRCKDQCNADEKDIQKCKKKKCCIGPRVIRLIDIYLQKQIPHVPTEDIIEMLINKNFSIAMERNYILPVLTKSIGPSPDIDSDIIPKDNPMNSATNSNWGPVHTPHTICSTKSDTKQCRDSANTSTPPPPPP